MELLGVAGGTWRASLEGVGTTKPAHPRSLARPVRPLRCRRPCRGGPRMARKAALRRRCSFSESPAEDRGHLDELWAQPRRPIPARSLARSVRSAAVARVAEVRAWLGRQLCGDDAASRSCWRKIEDIS